MRSKARLWIFAVGGVLAVAVGSAAAQASKPADMVSIPAGCVTVGPAKPHHALIPRQVCLPAFRVDRAEVTVAQHRACVAAGACKPPPSNLRLCNANLADRADHPANCATYDDAVAYCKWRGARLPSPDEWERATRGPQMTTYPWGEAAPTTKLAVMPVDEDRSTAPVCSRSAGHSAEGICDLAGNVAEWTSDAFVEDNRASHALSSPDQSRVIRGGSWGESVMARTSGRARRPPVTMGANVGFRCAADLPSPAPSKP